MSLLLKLWHDLYYGLATDRMVDFSMRCREVAHHVDVDAPRTFRLRLHLSLCQACRNYLRFSKFMNQQLNEMMHLKLKPDEIEKTNQKLLKKFCSKGEKL